MLREKLKTSLKEAMLTRDARRTSTLRLILAAIKDRDIALRTEETEARNDDVVIQGLLSKMIKQREESISAYQDAGRSDLVQQETEEIEIIKEYLPQQMQESEIEKCCEMVVKKIKAEGLKDMGKVITELRQLYAGVMDFGKAAQIVKKILSGR